MGVLRAAESRECQEKPLTALPRPGGGREGLSLGLGFPLPERRSQPGPPPPLQVRGARSGPEGPGLCISAQRPRPRLPAQQYHSRGTFQKLHGCCLYSTWLQAAQDRLAHLADAARPPSDLSVPDKPGGSWCWERDGQTPSAGRAHEGFGARVGAGQAVTCDPNPTKLRADTASARDPADPGWHHSQARLHVPNASGSQ